MIENNDFIQNQAIKPPFDDKITALEFIDEIRKICLWDNLVLMSDECKRNLIIILMQQTKIEVSLRLNLPLSELKEVLHNLTQEDKKIWLSVLQGEEIKKEKIANFMEIEKLLKLTFSQTVEISLDDFISYLTSDQLNKKIGRGESFNKDTKQTVWSQSHGRCMFTGCGEKLRYDSVSGYSGNFAYLAHNIASSEQGERGVHVLSGKLSNEPSNILLLCDKHHRLIDKVAACDFSATKLSIIREKHCREAEILLDGLSYEPIPVYSVLWPVNKNFISQPENREVANCLSAMKFRMSGSLNRINDNEQIAIDCPELFYRAMPSLIYNAAEKIIQQTRSHDYKAAIFAFGPMYALVALGACIGNKGKYIPMLRYRDGSCWMWPKNEPVIDFYNFSEQKKLVDSEDLVVCVNFTAKTEAIRLKALEISRETGAGIVSYDALQQFQGNACIPHPIDGINFSTKLHYDFHKFRNEFNIKKIHLLICASNAASFFIGQAYDLHHPEIIVYDFHKDDMQPVIKIQNDSKKTSIQIV